MVKDYTQKCEISKIREFVYERMNASTVSMEAFALYWVAMENNFFNTGDFSLFERFSAIT